MGSRENEKLQKEKATRRVAAVAFLTNISLSGSYKDTGWRLEYAKESAAAETSYPEGPIDDALNGAVAALENKLGSGEFSQHETDAYHEPFHSIRIRANTGSSEASFRSRHRRFNAAEGYPDAFASMSQRHAHFSSAESVEHGVRTRQISTSNISECSSSHTKELKILNLREIPMPKIRDERLVIMLSRRTPLLIFSALPYTRNPRHTRSIERPEISRRVRNPSGNRPLSALSDPDPLEQLVHTGDEEVSYGYLLQPSQKVARPENIVASTNPPNPLIMRHKLGEPSYSDAVELNSRHAYVSRCVSYDGGSKLPGSKVDVPPPLLEPELQDDGHYSGAVGSSATGQPNGFTPYSPHLLDDPELRAGKHRTLLTFPSYITSVIDYCKASDLKKELNDKFKDRFPHVQLTLSKLRSLKREMRRVAKTECNVDVLTVAQAYVYFEKLILNSFVTKYNRKLCSGACLLLSAKLNDVKGENLFTMIEKIETTFRVSRKDLLSFEFAVLVALEFALHVPTWEVFPHYQRLLYEC